MRYFIYCRKSSEGEERQALSLASQQEALAKSFGDKADIEIVGIYEEAKSAMTPGRPLFAEMLRRIEAGDAEGIVSWAPDRLARNSIDGGHVIYLLDRRILHDLKFATYTFEHNSQGKFMLSIMFGQSKYYSDALSENVKRGNATKVAMGWRPNRAPLGYKNCAVTKTTIPDPEQFTIIRHIFDLFLSGAYTPHRIVKMAQDQWGFLTPRRRRCGARPISRSTIYKTLSNPFYKGEIVWGGVTYPGRHTPMVTAAEYDKVQAMLNHRSAPCPQRAAFTYSGVLMCGGCGRAVTAERKMNRYGLRYTYYHCAARGRLVKRCQEPSVEERELDRQFRQFLASLHMPEQTAAWACERLQAEMNDARNKAEQFAAARVSALKEIQAQLRELTSLRLRRMVDDDEFGNERKRLEESRMSLENAQDARIEDHVIELLDAVARISKYAVKWFNEAEVDQKRALVKMLCSNPTLQAKKLFVEAAKPFSTTMDTSIFPRLLGEVDEVRTSACADTEATKNKDQLSASAGEQLLLKIYALKDEGVIEETLNRLLDLERSFRPLEQ